MNDDTRKTVILILLVLAFCILGLIITTLVDALKTEDPKPETVSYSYTCKECGYSGMYNGIKGFETCTKCGTKLNVEE